MAIPHIGGAHGVVRLGTLRFWAERGLIHMEDSKTNGYSTISIKEALERMSAISDMIHNTIKGGDKYIKYDKALEKNQSFLDEMLLLIRKAKDQGTPDNPQARREYVRRRPTTLVMPELPSF